MQPKDYTDKQLIDALRNSRTTKRARMVLNEEYDQRRLRAQARTVEDAPPLAPAAPQRSRLIDADSATRKTYPMATGMLDYFPDALAEASNVSWMGNQKHNPGEPMHHARGKSNDHADCIMRHLTERGGFDVIVIDGVEHKVRHSAALLWRAAALCQEEIEAEMGLPLPRGARAA